MLLVTCLLGFGQRYSLNIDTHQVDAAVVEQALEFDTEESGGDHPVTPECVGLVESQFVLSIILSFTTYQSVFPSYRHTTPLTRAPPLA